MQLRLLSVHCFHAAATAVLALLSMQLESGCSCTESSRSRMKAVVIAQNAVAVARKAVACARKAVACERKTVVGARKAVVGARKAVAGACKQTH
eukprot:scaffold271124_cov13-Tisochrysis_lutea.AAC.1